MRVSVDDYTTERAMIAGNISPKTLHVFIFVSIQIMKSDAPVLNMD